jgi:uncharacterized protein (TIGR03083 family)
MTIGQDELVAEFPGELASFSKLLRGLDEEQWDTPSRCEGWTVADVAAHVVGSMADIVAGRVEGLGSPEATAREVDERRGRRATELADELDAAIEQAIGLLALFDADAWETPAPGGYHGTLLQGVQALYYDTWAHAGDINVALGREQERGAGLRAGVHHVAFMLGQHGWGPAALALDGMEEVEVDGPAEGPAGPGAGRRITGDALQFVLAATGRGDPEPFGLDETINIYT